ncbi:preprotein translocase subunit SecE [Acetitomaculum ruminis DSM 5522]|uniref:Preprotein translocase subunit SecE n=2 Tax=Acetitomaculum ruminis TaxID=2382 RepID=A0A1I0YZV8_9FIRM|nr:preprotein translocase subunit SecE [Acetitomaculum ruminis DSM 5522]
MGDIREKTQKKSWFDGVKAEFNKIIWMDRKDVIKQTVAVSIVSIILGGIIAMLDFTIQYGIDILVNL